MADIRLLNPIFFRCGPAWLSLPVRFPSLWQSKGMLYELLLGSV